MTLFLLSYSIPAVLLLLIFMIPPFLIWKYPDEMEFLLEREDKDFARDIIIGKPAKYMFMSIVVSLCWFTMLPWLAVRAYLKKRGKK